ncbi:DUF4197 domain-containing protein [Paucibacter sediminis]|uniref:DUF4197 domain-containing protein n=1 Tax=Paucibacter sediminis TaxID=3019553 RepID=A0AA95NGA6_9BURK|nr:DUF4197 domain-containing protein [Paucibacter sp. S2-9]WIT13764.1 DUF4197 domain-containing protein [Paucibacter sp. S2-9]
MQRRTLLLAAGLLPLGSARALGESDAASGVRAALERGAVAAIGTLGRTDGFLGNPAVRIELPGYLKDAAKLLKATGQGRKLDELVTAMNRAAEAAMPEARQLLVGAVKSMSVEDAVRIVRGGEDSVTQFFAGKTRAPLTQKFLPIVTRATEKQGLADKYNAVAGKAAGFGLLRQEDANIQQYVTARALDGLYFMIGEEEKKIRQDPVGTGSAILKKVFGGL